MTERRGLLANRLPFGALGRAPKADPRVSANLRRDFQLGLTGGLDQAASDFQGGFDGLAQSTRQGLPVPVLEALSNLGVPGWGGLARERNAADAASAGLQAPGALPLDTDRAPISAMATPERRRQRGIDDQAQWRQPETPQIGNLVTPLPAGSEAPRRGLEPANAYAPQADMNQEWRAAQMRAREAILQEGYPYFQSPGVVRAGDAMAGALDQHRRDLAEQRGREGVSWEQWWRFGGRQDPTTYDPETTPAYRWSPPPPRRAPR